MVERQQPWYRKWRQFALFQRQASWKLHSEPSSLFAVRFNHALSLSELPNITDLYMAKKALFHLVTFQDGHRRWDEIIPAQSKAAISTAPRSPYVSVVSVKSLGWHVVSVTTSYTDEVMFQANIRDRDITVEPSQSGHSYLLQQFPDQARAVQDFVNGPYEA